MIILKRLNITKIDFTKKENQTLRNWFALMWQNFYIQLVIIAIGFIIGLLVTGAILWSLLPLAICGVVTYKGFYQFWNDMKNGTSR